MQVLQFEMLHAKPNHKQEKIESLLYLHRQIGLCTNGSFHESGQCNYIKNIKLKFFLRVIAWVFHDKDNESIT
jgi:hypothetical protein